MGTTVRPYTADELLQLPDDGFRYELIKGELIKMSPTGREARRRHDQSRSST